VAGGSVRGEIQAICEDTLVKNKIVSAAHAVALIRDDDTVAFSGFVGIGTPQTVIHALRERFDASATPRGLSFVFAAAPGDGKELGLNQLAVPGLVKRVIGGHYGLVPKLARMATANQVQAWNLPLGTMSLLFRDIAGKRAGCITKTGLGTFVDPRLGGGKVNASTHDDLVQLMHIDGVEWLLYKAFPIHVAILRGTTADAAGNITMEREALTLDNLALATAARNCGGLVIVQVERTACVGSLNPRQVHIPGILVDCVVVAPPEHHSQTFATAYSPAFAGELRTPLEEQTPLLLDLRKVIARRCAFELPMGGVVNLGIGIPEGVAAVANEERVLSHVTLTAEPGVVGGYPQGGLDFGAAINTDAILNQNQQFDFYDGGGLDLACLGLAQVDQNGHVNVSRFGDRLAGAGGFINISQNAKQLVFAGTFTTGGLDVQVNDGRLFVRQEGRERKFLSRVEQITFNGTLACESERPVLYVTERCVFRLTGDGLELTEVAPGIDIERDILAHMDFVPVVREPRPMDPRIFRDVSMQLADTLLSLDLAHRIAYDAERHTLFVNWENLHIRTRDDVDRVRRAVEERCESLGHRVALVANYDNCSIDDAVADTYAAMVRYLQMHYYSTASRYSTSAFLRSKLGAALERRRVAPHIFETVDDAREFLSAEEDSAVGRSYIHRAPQ
jgi:propionate CoA-transferase